MNQLPPQRPERFAFTLRFPEFRDAVDLIRMSGGAEVAKIVVGASTMSLVRERNGIHCTAQVPIGWQSIPWTEGGLIFTTKMTLFD